MTFQSIKNTVLLLKVILSIALLRQPLKLLKYIARLGAISLGLDELPKVELLLGQSIVLEWIETGLRGHHSDLLNAVLHDLATDIKLLFGISYVTLILYFLIKVCILWIDNKSQACDWAHFFFLSSLKYADNEVMSCLRARSNVKEIIVAGNVAFWTLIPATTGHVIIELRSYHFFERGFATFTAVAYSI